MASKTNNANFKIDKQRIWLHELHEVVVAAGGGNCDLKKLASTYYGGILWLNLQLYLIVTLGSLRESPRSMTSIDELIRTFQEVFPEVLKLHQLMPKLIFAADDVISYAGQHSRSWAGIVVEIVHGLVSIASDERHGISNFTAAQLLGQRGFEEGFVKVQLQIEFEHIQARIAAAGGTQQTRTGKTAKRGDSPHAPLQRVKSMDEKYRDRVTLILAAWEQHHFRPEGYLSVPMTKAEAAQKTTIERTTLRRTFDQMFDAGRNAGWNRYESLCSDESAMQRHIKRLRKPTIAQQIAQPAMPKCCSCGADSDKLREHESDELDRAPDAPPLLYCPDCWANYDGQL